MDRPSLKDNPEMMEELRAQVRRQYREIRSAQANELKQAIEKAGTFLVVEVEEVVQGDFFIAIVAEDRIDLKDVLPRGWRQNPWLDTDSRAVICTVVKGYSSQDDKNSEPFSKENLPRLMERCREQYLTVRNEHSNAPVA